MQAFWPDDGAARHRLLATALLVATLLLLALIPARSDAHQSGCHRWHSCPSDTGSYVCGDLGYTSGCPGGMPTGAPPDPVTAPSAVGPPDAANFVIGEGSGVTLSVDSADGSPSIRLATSRGTDAYGVLTGSVYPVALLPISAGATSYTAILPWYLFTGGYPALAAGTYYWQPYIIDSSACAANGCYVVGPIRSFTVSSPAPVVPVTPPTQTVSNSPAKDTVACVTDRRRRNRLSAQVASLRRQLGKTKNPSKRAQLRRKLKKRRAALQDARNAVAIDC